MKQILLIVMMGVSLMAHSQFNKKKPFNIGKVIYHAKWQTTQDVTYDGSYRIIDYPNGDVPENIGVCTDVIIRAYRNAGVDLQEFIHHTVKAHPEYYYPYKFKKGIAKADPNIDHRRVKILKKAFKMHFKNSKISLKKNWKPGDIVFFGEWHIGILIDEKVEGTDRYYCVHNIGAGPVMEDVYYDDIYDTSFEAYRIRF